MTPEPLPIRLLRPPPLPGPARTLGLLLLLGPVLAGSSASPALSQEQPVVLRGARLLTISGGTVENGILVLLDGRISAVGPEAAIPPEAEVLDLTGRTVMPGLVDGFTNLGAADFPSFGEDDDEATDPVTPQLRITDALNPGNRFIPPARSTGVTAALSAPADGNLMTGQSALVRLAGETVEEMIVRAPVAVHVSLGEAPKRRYGERNRMPGTRMGSAALLRQTLVDAQGYAEKWARYVRDSTAFEASGKGAGKAAPTPPARDLKLESLLPSLRGDTPLMVSADRFDDIHTALRIAEEFQLPVILNHGAEAHRVAEELARRKIPVVWGPSGTEYRELEARGGTPETPVRLWEAHVLFGFQTGSVENLGGLLEQARMAVAHGLPREEALAALTLHPARIFGAADRMGSLEVGKVADLVVFDRDPLDAMARVEMVFIGGRRYPPSPSP